MALTGNSITAATGVVVGKAIHFDVPLHIYSFQVSWTGNIVTRPNPTIEMQGTIDRKTWSPIFGADINGPSSSRIIGAANSPVIAIRASITVAPQDLGVAITVDLAASK